MKKSFLNGLFALFVLTFVFAFGPSVSQASAACHTANLSTPSAAGYTDGYYYSDQFIVPSWSTCHDINIRNLTGNYGYYGRAFVRVRFYPSSGGNYPNGGTIVDSDNSFNNDVVIASDVNNGTRYRVEWYTMKFSSSPDVYFQLKD